MNDNLLNKTIFMTGATSGLGKVSALKAANEGATLIVLARDKEKSQLLIEDYKKQYPDGRGKIELVEGNLTSFESTSNACNEVSSRFPVIDMIVNNAGIMNFEYKESDDHIEETFQVNLLSPLLVCHLLLENLKRSNSAKIIFTSSQMHQGEIYFDNLEFKDNFSSFKVYRHSKLAVILVCRTLAEELDKHQIGIYSQHPGMVRTELGRSAGWFAKFIFYLMGSSAEKGSQTLSYLIETKKDLLKTGEYYSQKKVTKTTEQSYNLATGEKIIEVARDYLSPYITSNSLIFKK